MNNSAPASLISRPTFSPGNGVNFTARRMYSEALIGKRAHRRIGFLEYLLAEIERA